MRFFFVVCCLLLSQQGYHRLAFFHNETETLVFAAEGKQDRIDLHAVRRWSPTHFPQHGDSLGLQSCCRNLQLQKTGSCSGERFLEELQSVVVVEDLNGVRQCKQLFGASFTDLVPFLLFSSATFFEVRLEFCVLLKSIPG